MLSAHKRLLLLIFGLALIFLISAVACGPEEPTERTEGTNRQSAVTIEQASENATPGSEENNPTREPTPTATPKPTSTPNPARRDLPGRTAATRRSAMPTEVPTAPQATPSPSVLSCPKRQAAPNLKRPQVRTSAETDRYALIALFNATDGESWDSSYTWLSRAPIGEWQGVTTDHFGRVTRLDLDEFGLTGELPPELGNLVNMQLMDLSGNQLSGEIPHDLGNLVSLGWLGLGENQLSGEIPPELGNLTRLQYLYLSYN